MNNQTPQSTSTASSQTPTPPNPPGCNCASCTCQPTCDCCIPTCDDKHQEAKPDSDWVLSDEDAARYDRLFWAFWGSWGG
ncbi:Protein of unknown function [Pyronema omphalodes CBS 100304]|uniref:Uncharacterized protein n=1 Tax=Pyronema omphalodes (strain CBS 100304) TaxID=1076935 RepID=U4LHF3_PYROM|nr:Protein of unknown function [Pyronema omphalodes CBS 100304]